MNTRCSWLEMVLVDYDIPEAHIKWCRHPNGAVVLDGEITSINKLLLFLYMDIYGTVPAEKFVADCESLSDGEIDRALLGDDGVDPISFWNFPGAPKELLDLSRQQE